MGTYSRILTKEALLCALALLVAFGTGFLGGVALWEGVAGPPGPFPSPATSEPCTVLLLWALEHAAGSPWCS